MRAPEGAPAIEHSVNTKSNSKKRVISLFAENSLSAMYEITPDDCMTYVHTMKGNSAGITELSQSKKPLCAAAIESLKNISKMTYRKIETIKSPMLKKSPPLVTAYEYLAV